MISNLFTIFDPSTLHPSLSLNWASLSLIIFLPSTFWRMKSKALLVLNNIVGALNKELEVVLGKTSGMMKILLMSLFVYIWLVNLIGLLPYNFTPTSHLAITLSLSLPLWLGYMSINSYKNMSMFLSHLVPKGTPIFLVPFMVLIEISSNIARPFTLSIRLTANMVAGHLLLSLLSMPLSGLSYGLVFVLMSGLLLLMFLELGVSFIQGYVFMTLWSLYLSEVNTPSNI